MYAPIDSIIINIQTKTMIVRNLSYIIYLTY